VLDLELRSSIKVTSQDEINEYLIRRRLSRNNIALDSQDPNMSNPAEAAELVK